MNPDGDMKAFVRTDAHDQRVEMASVPIPAVGEHEVRVAVEAFGVGVHDRYFVPPAGPYPYTIGIEGAGVVVDVGASVHDLAPGQRVMVSTAMHPKGGTWAEYVVADASSLTPVPDGLDIVTAAAIPVAGGTAVKALHVLHLHEGDTLFVAGASGAIGTLVVQMAAHRGIRVIGSASSPNHAHLAELGAEAAVDYRDPDWPAAVRRWASGGTDAALAIQPGTGAPSQQVVRPGGHVVTVSGDSEVVRRDVRVEQLPHRLDIDREMAELVGDITEGRIQLLLERTYQFDEAIAALEKTETRHARGKVVVSLSGTDE